MNTRYAEQIAAELAEPRSAIDRHSLRIKEAEERKARELLELTAAGLVKTSEVAERLQGNLAALRDGVDTLANAVHRLEDRLDAAAVRLNELESEAGKTRALVEAVDKRLTQSGVTALHQFDQLATQILIVGGILAVLAFAFCTYIALFAR